MSGTRATAKRIVRRLAIDTLKLAFKLFAWQPFRRIQGVRALVFDTAPDNTLFISRRSSETFIVSANDKSIGRQIYLVGFSDFQKLEKTVQFLGPDRSNDLLIDVGANIGTICIPAVNRRIFARSIAIEPEPFNFLLLQCNIQLNHLHSKINAYNIALGSRETERVIFELSKNNYGDHRVRFAGADAGLYGEKEREIVVVPSEPFDKIICDVNPNNTLIWIDTQGYEGHILQGASKALSRKPPLVIEFWPYGMKRSGAYPLLKEAIFKAGYQIFYDLESSTSGVPVNAGTLDELYDKLGESGNFTDILLR